MPNSTVLPNVNLIAELARANLKPHDVAVVIERDDKTAKNKIYGLTDFTLPEAIKVRDVLFPSLRLEYLYAKNPAPAAV